MMDYKFIPSKQKWVVNKEGVYYALTWEEVLELHELLNIIIQAELEEQKHETC